MNSAGGFRRRGIYNEAVPKPRLSELVPSAAQFDLTDIAFLKATSIVFFFRDSLLLLLLLLLLFLLLLLLLL